MLTTLTRLATSFLVVAAASLGAACVDEPLSTEGASSIDTWLEGVEHSGVAGPVTEVSLSGVDRVIIDGGLCACTSDACRDAFVESAFGCGVCLTVDCGGDTVGGCTVCADRPDQAGAGTIAGTEPPPGELDAHPFRRYAIARADDGPAFLSDDADTLEVRRVRRPPHVMLP